MTVLWCWEKYGNYEVLRSEGKFRKGSVRRVIWEPRRRTENITEKNNAGKEGWESLSIQPTMGRWEGKMSVIMVTTNLQETHGQQRNPDNNMVVVMLTNLKEVVGKFYVHQRGLKN